MRGKICREIDTARCTFGSAGADTYNTNTSPPSDVTSNLNGNDFNTQGGTVATFVFHDPTAGWKARYRVRFPVCRRHNIAITDGTLDFWAKTNSVGFGFRMFVYYTHGWFQSGGRWWRRDRHHPDGGDVLFSTTLATVTTGGEVTFAKPAATIKYKIGAYKSSTGSSGSSFPVSSVFPANEGAVLRRRR